ncbi:MAG: endonuclease [Flavobacteriales bacterium]|nr:endonuclease [Flavobacteriales bacterium]
MKKVLFIALFLPLIVIGQIIRPDSTSINFGNVMVGDTDSVQIVLSNTSSSAVNVNNVKFYSTYSEMPFTSSDTSFTIIANGTKNIWVYFSPIQNILHNSTMVIQHSATSGHEPIALIGQGKFPLTYYNSTENLSEQALKTALKTRLAFGYTSFSYNAARDHMFMTIDNKRFNGQGATVNTLECVYTGYNKLSYTSRSNAQSTSPQFNTEHTFPQGFFNSASPMRTDIHHLYPTTNNSNSQRGSKAFGVVTNGTAVTLGGGSFYTSSTFEPRNVQKGATARAMMYFVLRYQDYSNHFSSQETILRSWHNAYPVTSVDTARNNAIASLQNNRNPFIDYPQLEKRITNFVINSVAPSRFTLDVLQTAVDFGSFIAQQADTFDYVLVNTGNQVINFTSFALSSTSVFSFATGSGTNTSLNPGDALQISIVANTQMTGTFNENLTFSTNLIFPFNNFTIPVRGSSIITSIDENNLESQLSVFPNPFQNKVTVRTSDDRQLNIQLFDALGKETNVNLVSNHKGDMILSTEQLARGVYFLEIRRGTEKLVKKLIK